MKKTLLLATLFSIIFFGCGPKPIPEPELKTLVGHVYITPYVNPWGNTEYWGYEFKSNDTVEVIEYIDSQIIYWSEKYGYNFNFPTLEIESVKHVVNEDYTGFQEVSGKKQIFTKIK